MALTSISAEAPSNPCSRNTPIAPSSAVSASNSLDLAMKAYVDYPERSFKIISRHALFLMVRRIERGRPHAYRHADLRELRSRDVCVFQHLGATVATIDDRFHLSRPLQKA